MSNSQKDNWADELDSDNEVALLPPHACFYCEIQNPQSVVKCITCNKWFCNAYSDKATGSHIIFHLVKSKHRAVKLHSESPLGDLPVECFTCNSPNVFILGLVPSKMESMLIFLCREPCAMNRTVNEREWDLASWQPLIEERRFLPWIVAYPSPEDEQVSKNIGFKELLEIENSQIVDEQEDQKQAEQEEVVKKVRNKYISARQYYNIYDNLVKLEQEYDKSVKSSQSRKNIQVRWDRTPGKKYRCSFTYPRYDSDVRFVEGDELMLSLSFPTWQGIGTITSISDTEEIILQITRWDAPPPDLDHGYTVEFLWKATTFSRMRQGLNYFLRNRLSSYLSQAILGKNLDLPLYRTVNRRDLSVPGLPPLNSYQNSATRKALEQRLLLIQGPPGTGKTLTSTSIIYRIVNFNKDVQVLVCAPSNIAVDQLTEMLHKCGLKVVRLCARSREAVSSSIDFLTLHEQVRNTRGEFLRLKELQQLKENDIRFTEQQERDYIKLRDEAESQILQRAEVICCTCAGSFDPRLKNFLFKHVLIDEATQATEPECILPILTGAQQVILVGDHCQLGPVVMCKQALAAGYNKSLFERLVAIGWKPVRLHVQYRMHPCIAEFPSNTFYEGTLQNGVSIIDRAYGSLNFPWPVFGKPIFFYNTIGPEELSFSGTSYINRTEAMNVESIVTRFLKTGLKPTEIGIITPYEGQRSFIKCYMLNYGTLDINQYDQIEVSSVDSFQGREKNFIILSCVRSNQNLGVGFLADPRRLNVALTRAKYGLVICGNAKVLSRQPLWNNLLNYLNDNGVLVEGSLNNLKQSHLQLPPPQKLSFAKPAVSSDALSLLGIFAAPENSDIMSDLQFLQLITVNMKHSSVPAWSFGSKTQAEPVTTDKYTPGPAQYSTRQEEIVVPSYQFGYSERPDIFVANENPGPGDYSPTLMQKKQNESKRKPAKFEGAKLTIAEKAKIDAPGPSSYNPSAQTQSTSYSMGNNTYKLLDQHNFQLRTNPLGPGQYNCKDQKKNRNSYSIGKSSRESYYIKNTTPGPGNYNVQESSQTQQKGQGYRFGSGPRERRSASYDNPGPGAYGSIEKTQKGKQRSITPRRPEIKFKGESPGPGAYNPQIIQNKSGQTIGLGNRQSFITSYDNPSPGEYNPVRKSYSERSVSIGRGARNPISQRITPGPADYNNMQKQEGPKTTVRGRPQEQKSLMNNPGPGHYTYNNSAIQTRTASHIIGTSQRSNQVNKNPGPGSHYINRNLDGTCYSIGKDLRSKNQEPEEVGPGYYDIPPSVPDVPKYLLKSKKTGSKTLYKVNW